MACLHTPYHRRFIIWGGLKGEGAYLTDHSLTMHLFFGTAPPRHANIWGAEPPKPVIRAAYAPYRLCEIKYAAHIQLFLLRQQERAANARGAL